MKLSETLDPLEGNARRGREAEAARSVCIAEGVKGSAVAAVLAAVLHTAANRQLPIYAGANFRLKTLFWSSAIVSAFWVRSEQEATRQARLNYGSTA